jgi:nucleoside-triphosphatase
MHIFLTGEIQVGKSTVIKNIISRSGLSADGFMTYWEAESDGSQSLYISPYNHQTRAAERHFVTRRGMVGKPLLTKEVTEVFDKRGAEILSASGRKDIIVMDELGFLESDARSFHEAVLGHIVSGVPVLGVIKPARTTFLEAVRSHPATAVYEVTVQNRDELTVLLISEFELRMKSKD